VPPGILGYVADLNYRLIAEEELSDEFKLASQVFHGRTLTRSRGNPTLAGTVSDQSELESVWTHDGLQIGAKP
jgi:hypothetical protein